MLYDDLELLFVNKKKQKNFDQSDHAGDAPVAKKAKVFCFFFPKKKYSPDLISNPDGPP
jgi:hypothetical protein